jgi:hypothetical protein
VPAPEPDTSRLPATVRLPAVPLEPITRVPAVIAARSLVPTLNVPEPPATEIDLVPFGSRDTVPVPALMLPLNPTS